MIALADLEVFLGLDAGTDSALLTELESEAVGFVEDQTGRYFGASGNTTETLDGLGGRSLWLNEPAAAVVSVAEHVHPGSDPVAIAEADDDGFEVRGAELVRKGGLTWSREREYVVTYTRGYTQVDPGPPADIQAPAAIRAAVKKIVGYWYNDGDPAKAALQGESMGDYSYTRGATHSSDAAMLNAIPGLRQTLRAWRWARAV